MNNLMPEGQSEQSLVKLYMELTGSSELGARSVYMYWCDTAKEEDYDSVGGQSKPRTSGALVAALLLLLAGGGFNLASAAPVAGSSSTNALLTQPISLADAVNLALRQNPSILRAQKDLEASQGVVVQTRAVAIPKVVASGTYKAVQSSDADSASIPISTPPLTIGNDQNWQSQLKLVQSLYEGGKVLSSLRAARLTREQAMLHYQSAVADAVLEVQLGYYSVLLAAQQIGVQEASVELLERVLGDTTKRFEAGTVPRFDVLRAEVELANARPKLIRARNSYRISKHNLANLLGFKVPKETGEELPLTLSGRLEAQPFTLGLGPAIATALDRRTELGALRKGEALRREDILNARSGYKPSLQAFFGYDAHNANFNTTDLDRERHGWIGGVQMSWNLFDGFATQGKVKQAMALHDKAVVDLDDAGRRIELEVRTDYCNFIEADEVLKSQEKVVEQAAEALRLARARNEAGTGTQLDVLSAQTALTEARTTQIVALHDYAAARARLERAVGLNVSTPQ
jgi:outer membrane protein TolC